ncbi:MAG: hypothetical protein AB1595_05715 [bacterium]
MEVNPVSVSGATQTRQNGSLGNKGFVKLFQTRGKIKLVGA